MNQVRFETGLIATYSDDLPGLLVIGRSEEEITQKLPGAIRELSAARADPMMKVRIRIIWLLYYRYIQLGMRIVGGFNIA
jgi:hypothetical protein